jgi:histone-lysine N-methyltransferase SETMAR
MRALGKKRPGICAEDFILHQDNAPPHTAGLTQSEIDFIGFRKVSNPPYSPDLAPCDFEVFPVIKRALRGHRHADRQELITHVHSIVRGIPREFYSNTFMKWIRRHEKNINAGGVYFEKL